MYDFELAFETSSFIGQRRWVSILMEANAGGRAALCVSISRVRCMHVTNIASLAERRHRLFPPSMDRINAGRRLTYEFEGETRSKPERPHEVLASIADPNKRLKASPGKRTRFERRFQSSQEPIEPPRTICDDLREVGSCRDERHWPSHIVETPIRTRGSTRWRTLRYSRRVEEEMRAECLG